MKNMNIAKVKFKITMIYETTVAEYKPEETSIIDEIKLQKEYLETQREDLYSALDDAKLLEVEVLETEHYTVQIEGEPGNDYSI